MHTDYNQKSTILNKPNRTITAMRALPTLYLSIVLALSLLGATECRPNLDDMLLDAASMSDNLKRATAGFHGLRGKKWDGTYPDTAETLYKRALAGFMGLRGKKDEESFLGYEKKRAPSGFMGMRGKKKIYYPFYRSNKSDFSDKRAPMMFIGMRGKKSILDGKRVPLGFYGLRGR